MGNRLHSFLLPAPRLGQRLLQKKFGIVPLADVLVHLKQKLMHAVWDLLLTPEFIHANAHSDKP
jgi:hypothetical protein